MQAILRRTNGDLPGDVLRFDDLVLDEGRHEVFRGDNRIDLTATEFNLLRFFLLNPRRVLSKGQILQHVWRYDFGGNTNVVETYVSYLRRKLDAFGPPLIRTVRQAGLHARDRATVRPMLARLSLRARLLLGVIAIAAVGLVTADIATYTALKSFLIDRVDSTLNSVHQGVESVLLPAGPAARPGARPGRRDIQAAVQPDPGLLHRAAAAQRARRSRPRSASRSSATRSRRRARSCPATITLPAEPNTPEGDRIQLLHRPRRERRRQLPRARLDRGPRPERTSC